jgi:AcrR family transcriptional regulator
MGRKSKSEVRKIEILTQFSLVIHEDGFENASIAKIADKMKINPSLIIHYFKSKDEMVIELVDFTLTKFEQLYLEKFQLLDDPGLRFETTINFLLGDEWLISTEELHSVFYACYYLSTRNDTILKRFQKMYQQLKNTLAAEAKNWIEHKIIKNTNPEEVAEYIIILHEGLIFYEGINKSKDEFKKRSRNIIEKTISVLKA